MAINTEKTLKMVSGIGLVVLLVDGFMGGLPLVSTITAIPFVPEAVMGIAAWYLLRK